jgi:hypothetical protein
MIRWSSARAWVAAAALATCALAGRAVADEEPTPYPDSMVFAPPGTEIETWYAEEGDTPRAMFGDPLLVDPETWIDQGGPDRRRLLVDYNRVDRIRVGLGYARQDPATRETRYAARLSYAFQRERLIYGVQVEQPLMTPHWVIGGAIERRTDHHDLQQVGDVENSLALLFARTDYRDYFERTSGDVYTAYRFPGITRASLHWYSARWRSIPLDRGTRSWFYQDRDLRENPPIRDADSRSLTLRLEQRSHPSQRLRAGLAHWIEIERAGNGIGGDLHFTRLIADARSIVRLSPAMTLALRTTLGHTMDGVLPPQRAFVMGGTDGLRAHGIASLRGDQLALGQAEATIGLWKLRSRFFEGGLHAIGFVDVGAVWTQPSNDWDVGRQPFEADAGFGLGTAEDNLRVYFAKNLHDSGSDLLVTLRLQRPF